MTKLKTLKDIAFEYRNEEYRNEEYFPEEDFLNILYYSIYSVRKEAIKWYHRSDDDKHKFIKEFFNITDEDLI